MSKARRYPPRSTQSEVEVFIIESLAMAEEMRQAFEGQALADGLRTLGWRPIYQYVRTAAELQTALELFRHSKCRFLHLSVHGSASAVFTTLEEIPNAEFAAMTAKKLPNRRVTFSACEVGSGSLVNLIQKSNKGVESIAAPLDEIDMRMALPFWLSFYAKALADSGLNFRASGLSAILGPLCSFFGFRLNWSYWTPVGEKWNNVLLM